MKKKLFWIVGILAGLLLVAVVGLTLFVKSYLRTDKLSALILPRIESATGRKAAVKDITISLRGITVQELTLKEKNGTDDFTGIKKFVLKYRLAPILKKRLVITKIEVVSPFVKITRLPDGRYNFSDIVERMKTGQGKQPAAGVEKGVPYSLETEHISVRDAKLSYADSEGTSLTADCEGDFETPPGAALQPAAISGTMKINRFRISSGHSEINGTGDMHISKEKADFKISTSIGNDTVDISGAANLGATPEATVDLAAKKLDLDRLAAFSGPKPKGTPKAARPAAGGPHSKGDQMPIHGTLKVSAAKYGDYTLRDFSAKYDYRNGRMEINPLSTGIAGGTKAVLAGTVRGDLRFSTTAGPDMENSIKNSAAGKITADLSKCEMKGTKMSSAIASVTGIPELRDPRFDSANFIFNIANRKIQLNGNMTSARLTLNPAGFVTMDKVVNITADLKLAPSFAGRVPGLSQFIKGDKGWVVIPLKITGTTDNPAVAVNRGAMQKQVTKTLEKQVGKGILKGLPFK